MPIQEKIKHCPFKVFRVLVGCSLCSLLCSLYWENGVLGCPSVALGNMIIPLWILSFSDSVRLWENVGKTLEAISSQVPLTTQPPFRRGIRLTLCEFPARRQAQSPRRSIWQLARIFWRKPRFPVEGRCRWPHGRRRFQIQVRSGGWRSKAG